MNTGKTPTCDITITVVNPFPVINSAGHLVGNQSIWTPTKAVDDNGYSLYPALFQVPSVPIPIPSTAPLLTIWISNVQNMDGEYYLVAYEPPNTSFSTGEVLFMSSPFTLTSGKAPTPPVNVFAPVATQVRRVNGTVQWWFMKNDKSGDKIGPVDTQLELYWIFGQPLAMWTNGVWVTILRDIFTMLVSQGAPSNPPVLPVTEANIVRSIVNLCFAQTAGPYAKHYAIVGGGNFYTSYNYFLLEDYFDNSHPQRPQIPFGDPPDSVICYDMSAMVQVMLGAVGIPNQRVKSNAFGYFNDNLIGWGPCNNPNFGFSSGYWSNEQVMANPAATNRTWWGDHSFVMVPDTNTGNIVDACGGPHYGTEDPAAYYAAAVDTRTDPDVRGLYGREGLFPSTWGTPSSIVPVPNPECPQITSITAVSPPTLGATRGAATALDVVAAPKLFDGKMISADVPAAMGAAAQATQLTLSSSRVVPGPASALHSVKLQDSAGRMLRGHLFVEQNAEAAVARLHNELSTVDTSMGEFYDPGPTERLGPVSFVAKGGITSVLWLHRNLAGIFRGSVPQETAVSLIENLQSQLEPQAVDALSAEAPKFGELVASVEVGSEVTLRASLDTSGTISFVADPGALRLLKRSGQTITFLALQEGNYEVTVFSVHPKTLLASRVSSTINITGSSKSGSEPIGSKAASARPG